MEVEPAVTPSAVQPQRALAAALAGVELDGEALAEEHGRRRPPG